MSFDNLMSPQADVLVDHVHAAMAHNPSQNKWIATV